MLLRGDRKSSWRVVWKDNALGIRRGWYYDAHRKRINGRSRRWRRIWVNRSKFQQEDQEEPGNLSKTVTLFLFDFEFLTYEYISWPDMYSQRTFDEDRHENQMFSLSLVYWVFFTIFVPISRKQQTRHVMTLSLCKNVRILIFGATGSAANVLRAPGSTVK